MRVNTLNVGFWLIFGIYEMLANGILSDAFFGILAQFGRAGEFLEFISGIFDIIRFPMNLMGKFITGNWWLKFIFMVIFHFPMVLVGSVIFIGILWIFIYLQDDWYFRSEIGTIILTLFLFSNSDFRLVGFFIIPEMVSIISIFTKKIFSILQKPIRKLFCNFEKFRQILAKFVVQKLEYIPHISGVFVCYLAFSFFTKILKEVLRKCFIAPISMKNGKNQHSSKKDHKIDDKRFKISDIFQTEKDDEIVEKNRGNEKSEKPWTSFHQLNPKWKYFGQNFRKTEIQEIEKFTGKEWTKKLEERRKNKTEDQKIKDRKLIEEIGYWEEIDGENANPNLSKIKKLLDEGAEIDYFVPYWNDDKYPIRNTFDFAIYQKKEEIINLFLKNFSDYRKETNGDYWSLLGHLFNNKLENNNNLENIGIELVKTKQPVHPIYDLIRWYSGYDGSEFENILKIILSNYNPGPQIKLALQKLAENNEFQLSPFTNNLPKLKKYFSKHFGPDYLKSIIGSTYKIEAPICELFLKNGKKFWVVQEIQNLGLNGIIKFEKDSNGDILVYENSIQNLRVELSQDFEIYLQNKLNSVSQISVDFSKLLGIGGESIVFRKFINQTEKALKVAPYNDLPQSDKNQIKLDQANISTSGDADLENSFSKNNFKIVEKNAEFSSSTLKHENLISYQNIIIDVVNDEFAFVIEMEIFDENLWQFFKRKNQNQTPVLMPERFKMFEKIWDGLHYIQQNGFYHLDLKLSNFLIKNDVGNNWDGKTLVISDFGIGGKDLKTLGKSGTPGFSSPEQLIGQPHRKSDNYGFGRVMVYLFCDWNTAWDSLFQPITDAEFKSLSPSPTELELFSIFADLTKTNPTDRIELDDVKIKMAQLKNSILNLAPISNQNATSFDYVDENTQGSVHMQKELFYAAGLYSTQKRISSILITEKVHDQKETNLCTSIGVISALRSAQRKYLVSEGKDLLTIMSEQDDIQGTFSFDKCLVLFTGCVSPRSLDGILVNNLGSEKIRKNQQKRFGTAIYRLVHRTGIDIEGWKRLLPVTELFEKYQIDIEKTELIYKECFHPDSAPPGGYTYEDALNDGHVVVVVVFSNWVSNRQNVAKHIAHTVVLFDQDSNYYFIKNSSHKATPHGDKLLEISKTQMTHDEFCNPRSFRKVRSFFQNNQSLKDENLLLGNLGMVMIFKQK